MVLARPAKPRASSVYVRFLLLAAYGFIMFWLGSLQVPPASPQVQVSQHPTRSSAQPTVGDASQHDVTDARLATATSTEHAGASPYLLAPFDMAEFLGQRGIMTGFIHDAHTCTPGWKNGVNDTALLAQMKEKLRATLVNELGPLAASPESIKDEEAFRKTQLLTALGVNNVDDPRFARVNRQLSSIIARFLLNHDGTRHCLCGKVARVKTPVNLEAFGTSGCTDGEPEPEDLATECIGQTSGILLSTSWGVDDLVEQLSNAGICTSLSYQPNYAQWWILERLNNRAYQNFDVATKQEDMILELFDIMYERNKVFLKQKWLGVSMMQDPFDLLSIQNLLYDLRPDLIIETGTANGGSALVWASILEILGLHNTRIHTVDLTDPRKGFGSGSGIGDPTKHRLWSKYVTFHEGLSTDPRVVDEMRAAAQNATTVMALLDSDHFASNVAPEMEVYCKTLVTVNSYCIVEDTKLSRMVGTPGPLEAVRDFLKENNGAAGQQKWMADRERELMYSQHVMGYLKRLA